ncbi:hypothetical protein PLANPX_5870 [Lacipirellula parvula]|uniref:Uncharacterized protein n=1 Tax=Lacipirellula parvula TaxID=2650471 RepID=A0A5K7XIH4_9BACT|nr:hypothetical protein PLANPX_5870 [Lacipirellula parvula]
MAGRLQESGPMRFIMSRFAERSPQRRSSNLGVMNIHRNTVAIRWGCWRTELTRRAG